MLIYYKNFLFSKVKILKISNPEIVKYLIPLIRKQKKKKFIMEFEKMLIRIIKDNLRKSVFDYTPVIFNSKKKLLSLAQTMNCELSPEFQSILKSIDNFENQFMQFIIASKFRCPAPQTAFYMWRRHIKKTGLLEFNDNFDYRRVYSKVSKNITEKYEHSVLVINNDIKKILTLHKNCQKYSVYSSKYASTETDDNILEDKFEIEYMEWVIGDLSKFYKTNYYENYVVLIKKLKVLVAKSKKSLEKCNVCLEMKSEDVFCTLECHKSHKFCKDCIKSIYIAKGRAPVLECPMCRQHFEVFECLSFEELNDNLVLVSDDEEELPILVI